ncbi:MAG TPA: excinuclease ABC subunit UvrA [Nitrospiria bacterium]|jgi:excinuclease ABC subunit A
MAKNHIHIKGAQQNNLKSLNLKLPLNELIVVTGVSGSGKSSLAFDTIYAEGQRRYVETFSPYARQFLDRMDKPHVDRIEGIPPTIAIDQTNPVRTSRSTVGTMTELNDHLKLFFARAAQLFCKGCGQPVQCDTPDRIFKHLLKKDLFANDTGLLIVFPVKVPINFSRGEIKNLLAQQGYTKIHREDEGVIEVIQDRVVFNEKKQQRIIEGLEAALRFGQGMVFIYPLDRSGNSLSPVRFSSGLHCPKCNLYYRGPVPNLFSFNSPIGACEACRGFGRTMGIDFSLVIPDETKTLAGGAIKPWQTESNRECQEDLIRFARKRGIPTGISWKRLKDVHKRWVIEGEGFWEDGKWYGVKRFFNWLETKSYKMHIRVLLSKYRAYNLCAVCGGSRLKEEALVWRLGSQNDAKSVISLNRRFNPPFNQLSDQAFFSLPGLTFHDVILLPIERCYEFFNQLHLPSPLDAALDLLLKEIRIRLQYLVQVGLGYLTLDRQSRTLSGGEVQRINLTTALGTSLVNTLFVLDEPSIGLHPRDMGRVIEVLRQLQKAGNSLIVVEHDPQIMLAADRILDLGPGPGAKGGRVVFWGTPKELLGSKRSLTADYLSGRKAVASNEEGLPKPPATLHLEILGASENNLKEIDVKIPLNRLVCITGVSGSGKSTLVQDICYKAIRKIKGHPVDPPGKYRALRGHEKIQEVVLVDQSPIGKTTRSNPSTYVGALDSIRKAFANEPLSKERGYSAGTFSFNSGRGRCGTCGGNGFEHVEMQFLSDVYLRCPDCDGRRYREEILEVKLIPSNENPLKFRTQGGKSISEVLELTVSEAMGFFQGYSDVLRSLEPLQAVGLEYLKLGQPVPTLSGGEAQRLKLAGHLAKAKKRKNKELPKLFLFDEPTTGLHFHDIATLVKAMKRLVLEGHSLIIIEHNLDVIRAADWVIDLGPDGGEAGGEVICQGTPHEVAKHEESHTGQALEGYQRVLKENDWTLGQPQGKRKTKLKNKKYLIEKKNNPFIQIHNAREHNLKGVEIQIPRDKFTVITGVSGSGKSTVAFDILFAEGQRRYLESLNAYARQFVQPASKPDVDAIFGIPPTVAIGQRTSRGGRKSTVATLTEIYHFLRLLFVKLGIQFCPECQIPIKQQSPEAIFAKIMKKFRGQRILILAPLVVSRKGYYTDLASWAQGKGFSHLRVDGHMVATGQWPRLDRFKEHHIELPIGEMKVVPKEEARLVKHLEEALSFGKGIVQISPSNSLFSVKRACSHCGRSFGELDPRLFSYNSKHGWCAKCFGAGIILPGFDEEQSGEEIWWNDWWEGEALVCEGCNGKRLRPEALAVQFQKRSIADLTAMSVEEANRFFKSVRLGGREALIARDIFDELCSRLLFLKKVGLSYLSLDRSAPTLSGGEAQRIRLASQLGSNLKGVCYILDEPTIGLHPRDNRRLLDTLHQLEAKGNTVVVVEHDEETIRSAEYVVDLGPGAGFNGGRVVAQGSVKEIVKNPESVTGQFLLKPLLHPLMEKRDGEKGNKEKGIIGVQGATLHNLKNIRVEIPLGKLVCVTGVSGSGKSTLVRSILHHNLRALLQNKKLKGKREREFRFMGCRKIVGWEPVTHILEVDQTPIGKTPRSCPATYVGFWSAVRQLFSETPEARMRGYGPSRFSFNVKGGRCEECEGQGAKKIEMSFLPDVSVVCEACKGDRFSQETLMVRFKEKNISEVLRMSVEEASKFFSSHFRIHGALRLLEDVGLGYLTLGQQSPTLSGGEAQRIKLVTELAKAKTLRNGGEPPWKDKKESSVGNGSHSLYVLDEPTIGLHMADVEKLIRVLHRLVSAGNTVLIIEHNLDIIAEADWVIDLGPEGGNGGGEIVGQGSPEDLAKNRKKSHTAKILSTFLKERGSKKKNP